jgi:hypothetical protein
MRAAALKKRLSKKTPALSEPAKNAKKKNTCALGTAVSRRLHRLGSILMQAYVRLRQHMSASANIRQHTPTYVSIREHS